MRPGELTLECSAQDNRHTLTLVGELDIATAPYLEKTALKLCADGASEVLLDLRQLTFVDSIGLRSIIAAQAACEERGCALLLTRGPEPVQRLFDLTGTADKLPFRA